MLTTLKPALMLATLILGCWPLFNAYAQYGSPESIADLVRTFKQDPRGPYRDIRWFCSDGTTNPAKEPCAKPGGVQRARYKEAVLTLAQKQHIFLGQILATTNHKDFWDAENYHSRLKQYQLERYLRAVDNGWINRKAQYYRGAMQAEDEEAWGRKFLLWLLSDKGNADQYFYLVRQAVRDIPHREEDQSAQQVRALSKRIADAYPKFSDLRVKIHGQPEPADIVTIKAFMKSHSAQLSKAVTSDMQTLIAAMEQLFMPAELSTLKNNINILVTGSPLKARLLEYVDCYSTEDPSPGKFRETALLIYSLRKATLGEHTPAQRLAMLDLSLDLEYILYSEIRLWDPGTLRDLLDKIGTLSQTAAGAGFLEVWEWEQIRSSLEIRNENIPLAQFSIHLDRSRSVVEWSTSMVRAVYGDVVRLYSQFEPLSYGFIDDRIRGSILLPLGNAVSALGNAFSSVAGFSNQIIGIPNPGDARGLNQGFARGELVVIAEAKDEMQVSPDKIYVFDRPPSDLKPVAGIATVSEGNMVSHVQLLARNLGIPNAVISTQNLRDLDSYNGQTVFYAVSPKGTIIMKLASEMTPDEKKLFETKARSENRISVPVDKINLQQTDILDLRDVQADASGKLCGPKAANLGQLKAMFPDHVVEGIVIPFGIFRMHLAKKMPGQSTTYWECLEGIFDDIAWLKKAGKSEADIEAHVLSELEYFREKIRKIAFLPEFEKDLRDKFRQVLGKDIGNIGVFLRSDTNMEDLKEFTGAGLNLTLFNVLSEEKVLQGIRDVWASPYAERSYKWRQRYLLNPEHVYPSILIIPGVNVAKSGVMITTGISSREPLDNSVAFNRGVGGAVEGQIAESWLVVQNGEDRLLSPAREPQYTVLMESGGTAKQFTDFSRPILDQVELDQLKVLGEVIRNKLPTVIGMESSGPFDVELGFLDGKIWLFQVRPFVENKIAARSEYLQSITPEIKAKSTINLNSRI